VPEEPLVSYAQNGEDVVLWRVLGHVEDGVYVDVGGWDPDEDSVTRLFYERGWRGIDIEPVPDFAAKFRRRRPHNEVVEAVITDQGTDEVVLHRFGTSGLSTVKDELAERHVEAGLAGEDIAVPARRLDDVLGGSSLVGDTIHFLKIDVEGAEAQVVRSVDLQRWRPWVLVIEATEPNSVASSHEEWEPLVLAAGYTFALFDGLSRFYVSPDHPELLERASYPACTLDGYVPVELAELRAGVAGHERELAEARDQAMRWRTQAVTYWANAMARAQAEAEATHRAKRQVERLRGQLAQVRRNLQDVREDRRRLRARAKQLAARLEELEQQQEPGARPARQRLRTAVQKVRGT